MSSKEKRYQGRKRCLHENCGPIQARQIRQNHDLLSRDNVVFTPHIGFYSGEALRRILDTTLENITKFTLGKIENQIMLPPKK